MSRRGIVGHLAGELWWPMGALASKPVRLDWQSGEFASLRVAVETLMRGEDGDFSNAARLTADSYVYVKRGDLRRTHVHRVDIGQFPSIADYVSDAFAYLCHGD